MSTKRSRVFSRKFKFAAVRRMMAGENVSALSRKLRVLRKDLYLWRSHFRAGGPEALRGKGRPRKVATTTGASPKPAGRSEDVDTARQRIAELERKIGQQQVDLDFFQQALRRVGGARRRSAALGALPSTPSSKR